jgi:hypothetical protein
VASFLLPVIIGGLYVMGSVNRASRVLIASGLCRPAGQWCDRCRRELCVNVHGVLPPGSPLAVSGSLALNIVDSNTSEALIKTSADVDAGSGAQ